jgi:hypothetical protein
VGRTAEPLCGGAGSLRVYDFKLVSRETDFARGKRRALRPAPTSALAMRGPMFRRRRAS